MGVAAVVTAAVVLEALAEGPVAAALGQPSEREQGSGTSTHAGHMVGARLVVAVAVDREGSERSVEAMGSGRTTTMGWALEERSVEATGSGGQTTTGWTLEEGQPRHRRRGPEQRLVAVAAAVGREGSRNGKERQRAKKRPPAAAGVMVVLRKR